MFSPRFSILTLALLVCGFQANQVKAMQATKAEKKSDSSIDTRAGISKPFSEISEACKDVRAVFNSKIRSKDFKGALETIDQMTDMPAQIDKRVAAIQGSENLQALTDCTNSLKQDLVQDLNEAVNKLEIFEHNPSINTEDLKTISELKSQIKAIITTQDDVLFLALVKAYDALKTKFEAPAPFQSLKGLSRECDTLIAKFANSHPSKSEDKEKHLALAKELKSAIDARINHKPAPEAAAPEKTVVSTPGSKTKWIIAGAVAVTAGLMAYGEVHNKMLTKMFTQMTKYLTPLATRMGLVKVEKVVAPMVVKQLSFWQRFLQMLRFA